MIPDIGTNQYHIVTTVHSMRKVCHTILLQQFECLCLLLDDNCLSLRRVTGCKGFCNVAAAVPKSVSLMDEHKLNKKRVNSSG